MSYKIRDAQGRLIGMLPDSLRAVGQAVELRSLGGERPADIPAGKAWAVPVYVVGSGELEVFLDGVACMSGTAGQYAEFGDVGASSETIIWNIEITTDKDILVRSK